ncbi:MAG: hypothetical protein ACRENG_23435, partial [bacterium]
MNCTENHVMARRPQAAPAKACPAKGSRQTRAGKFTTLLSVLILAVILGSMPAPPNAFGQIVLEETQTGGSSASTTVTTSTNLTGVSGHLYLAAISMRARTRVLAVSGLGLKWTLVRIQCAGHGSTGIEVWKAQGTPNGNGAVTATVEIGNTDVIAPKRTVVIAVSRYSGVAVVNPIGKVISGNTIGMNASATCAGGMESASYSFNLTTTANDAVVYGAAAMKTATHTPGAGYT